MQGNMTTCLKCPKQELYRDGYCLGCYGLSVVEKSAWQDGRQAWFTCPQCNIEWSKLMDTGICWDCNQKKWDEFTHKRDMEEKFKRIFGSVKAMNHYTFDRFMRTEGNSDALDIMREFDSSKENVYLWGTCGTGKTHLAYAAAKKYALNGKTVVVTTPLKMTDTFRTKSNVEKEDSFEEFTECDLLFIDDLGITRNTDFALEVFCEILNRRTLQMRNGLIVTSNLSIADLAQKNRDDRLSSRLSGMCKIVGLTGEDYRLKKGLS